MKYLFILLGLVEIACANSDDRLSEVNSVPTGAEELEATNANAPSGGEGDKGEPDDKLGAVDSVAATTELPVELRRAPMIGEFLIGEETLNVHVNRRIDLNANLLNGEVVISLVGLIGVYQGMDISLHVEIPPDIEKLTGQTFQFGGQDSGVHLLIGTRWCVVFYNFRKYHYSRDFGEERSA